MIFDNVFSYLMYSQTGLLFVKIMFLIYPIVITYVFIRVLCKKFSKRISFLMVFLFSFTLILHVFYFMPYSLDMSKNEVVKIDVSDFEENRIIIEDEHKIQEIIDLLSNIDIRNSMTKQSLMSELHFSRQKSFSLSCFEEDLVGHVIFIKYYDETDIELFDLYVWIANDAGEGHFVKIINEDKIVDLQKIIYN